MCVFVVVVANLFMLHILSMPQCSGHRILLYQKCALVSHYLLSFQRAFKDNKDDNILGFVALTHRRCPCTPRSKSIPLNLCLQDASHSDDSVQD